MDLVILAMVLQNISIVNKSDNAEMYCIVQIDV